VRFPAAYRLCLISELLKCSHLHKAMLLSTNSDRSSCIFYFIPELAFLFRRVRNQSKNFEDENFVDSKSSAKTAKIKYLENLYVYSRKYNYKSFPENYKCMCLPTKT